MSARAPGTRATAASVAVVLLSLALVSGCVDRGRSLDDIRPSTGSGPGQRPYEVVQSSYDELAAAGTAKVRSESATEVAAQRFVVTGTGEADFRRRAYDLALNLPLLGAGRAVGVDNVVYVRSDRLRSEIPGSRSWLLVDPVRLQAVGAQNIDNPFVRFAQSTGDALPQLALVKGARTDTRVVGPDTVAGEPVTRYATELDTAQARRYAYDPAVTADLDRYARTLRVQTLPAEVWVDAQGRLRQLNLTFLSDFGRPATTAMLTFSGLGAPIGPIAAPPSDQVTDAATVLPGVGG